MISWKDEKFFNFRVDLLCFIIEEEFLTQTIFKTKSAHLVATESVHLVATKSAHLVAFFKNTRYVEFTVYEGFMNLIKI